MRRISLAHTGRWMASLLVAAGVVLTGFISPAWDAQGAMLGIMPADEANYFTVELLPGAQTRRTAIVSNRSGQDQNVTIYPADGLTTPQGGFAVRKDTDPRLEVAAWTHLPVKELLLAPGADREVSFQINVPIGTPSGDYTGGIVIQSPVRQGETSQVNNGTAVQINIIERVAARIYLRIPAAAPKAQTAPISTAPTATTTPMALTLRGAQPVKLKVFRGKVKPSVRCRGSAAANCVMIMQLRYWMAATATKKGYWKVIGSLRASAPSGWTGTRTVPLTFYGKNLVASKVSVVAQLRMAPRDGATGLTTTGRVRIVAS